MEDQYGMADLRQLVSGSSRSHFTTPTIQQQPPQLFHTQLHHHYDLMMITGRSQVADVVPRGIPEFHSDSVVVEAAADTLTGNNTGLCKLGQISGVEIENGFGGGDGSGTGRWPRQETLILLEIRSRLDHKFKESNQKGPLWDEVSRIMSEEHGYERSGKKCREKFENLYKYYKKTKEGKAGRQDGKNYRFFRQLEALYGESTNAISVPEIDYAENGSLRFNGSSTNNPPSAQANTQETNLKDCESLSFSNCSEFDSSSSDEHVLSSARLMDSDVSGEKRRKRSQGGRRSWKAKIKEFIGSQMRKLMEKQEAWLEKLTSTIEQKEKERMIRDEEWRKQELSRIEIEHRLWAKEREWIEARDTALMEALQKLTEGDVKATSLESLIAAKVLFPNNGENLNEDGSEILNNNNRKDDAWPEAEITRLIQLWTSMESKFKQVMCEEEEDVVWEEIAAKMGCFGYERSGGSCKEKWECVNKRKKRKEKSRSCNQGGTYFEIMNEKQGIEKKSSPSSSNIAGGNLNVMNDSCFRFLMNEEEPLWENYGMKLINKRGS